LQPLKDAWALVAAGDADRAYNLFAEQFRFWKQESADTLGFVDSERGTMLAALFAKNDRAARAMLQRILLNHTSLSRADQSVFSGQWQQALMKYRSSTRDNAVVDPDPNQPDPIVSEGVALALRGREAEAVSAWSQPADGGGPYDLTATQLALIGIEYARLQKWPLAEHYWLLAARYDQALPQYAQFSPGNVTALSMLFHFRTQFPRGNRRYRWP
jgi:hypothetical protein